MNRKLENVKLKPKLIGLFLLVGPDRLMRSDSSLSPDTHSVNFDKSFEYERILDVLES